jgi:transposase
MQKYGIFIGIDISKEWFDAALCIEGNLKQMPHRRFNNEAAGFKALQQWVTTCLGSQHRHLKQLYCMEHTGMYSLKLGQYLQEQGLDFVQENPLRIKRSLGLRRGKSDKADAKAIAEYAWRFQDKLPKVRPLPSGLLLQVQVLLSCRKRMVRYRQGLNTAQQELCANVPDISQLIAQPSEAAITALNQQIARQEEQMLQLLKSDEHLKHLYELVCSVIGVGPVIAANLIVHTNAFSAFEKSRQFACHIGTAPFDSQSGTSLDAPARVSQMANHALKTLLSTAAVVAVRHDPQIRAYFLRQQEAGKKDGWIYNAVKNKILHRIFAVVKRDTPYVKMQYR